MKAITFTQLRNFVVPSESGQVKHQKGFGLIAWGPKSIILRKNMIKWLGVEEKVFKKENTRIVFQSIPKNIDDIKSNFIGVYHVSNTSNGRLIDLFEVHQKDLEDEVLNYLMNTFENKFAIHWYVSSVNKFFKKRGFDVKGHYQRQVEKSFLSDPVCFYCNAPKVTKYDPVNNNSYCSDTCFEKQLKKW